MKNVFRFSLIFVATFLLGGYAFSQGTPVDLKASGQIPIPAQITPLEPVSTILPVGNKLGALKIPLDGTFTQVSFLPDYTGVGGFYSDDGSTAEIPLPFNFCLYGSAEPHMWINNNGNCSFDGPKPDFTSTGFPSGSYIMLAPFWADVDTRTGLGDVWYKVEPHRAVVIWNQVGYYGIHGDKRNTFELIFTDGTDPLLGAGNNVAFSYTTMQWTTGDASNGVNGFGGVPATVGVNKGDGVKYALVGRFDHAGADYDGAGGANDGVSYLDGKYFEFNACQETIVIPPAVPTLGEWGLILLGVALLGVGVAYIMRRQRSNVSI